MGEKELQQLLEQLENKVEVAFREQTAEIKRYIDSRQGETESCLEECEARLTEEIQRKRNKMGI